MRRMSSSSAAFGTTTGSASIIPEASSKFLIRRLASGFSEASPGCTGYTPRNGPAKAPASNHIIFSCHESANWRQVAIEALDLNRRELACASLCKGRRADIACEHIRIAVHTKRHLFLRIHGIVPGPGRQLNDARRDTVSDMDRGKEGAALVEDADDVAIGDAARAGIARIH